MARVQLELPEQFLYTHTINVRMTDLNTGKHVGNDPVSYTHLTLPTSDLV